MIEKREILALATSFQLTFLEYILERASLCVSMVKAI